MSSDIMSKKARKRSTSYPAFTLEEVIEATRNLKEKLGDGPYSRDHMAVAMGYKGITGSSGSKIAACVHFGMLDRNGNVYSQSDLARRLFHYVSEEERIQVLKEAFSKPSLHQKLIAEYNGKSLPQMLESILIRNYGIQEGASRSAVANFKDSAEFVGVLKNGVLVIDSVDAGVADETVIDTVNDAVGLSNTASISSNIQQGQSPAVHAVDSRLSVTLPSGLVIGYSQELAPAFAFGRFGDELIALDNAISNYKNENMPANTSNSCQDDMPREES